jgi:hypothetical protein
VTKTATATSTRDSLRASILGTKHVKSETVDFFGHQVEVRQPTLGKILELRRKAGEDEGAFAVQLLTEHVYVPGTDENIFDKADEAEIKQLPFGDDFNRVMNAYQRLVGTVNDPLAAETPTESSEETD